MKLRPLFDKVVLKEVEIWKDLVGPLPPHVAASGARVLPSPYGDGR